MKQNNRSQKVRSLVLIAVLSALGAALMLLDIPIAFYKLDLSLLPTLFGGFALGVLPAITIAFLTQVINLLMDASITGGVGELANFLICACMAVPCVWLYRKSAAQAGKWIACGVGVLCMMFGGALLNYFVLIPAYVAALKIPQDAIISMASKVVPSINSIGSLILFLTIPFNFVKGTISAVLVMFLCKRLVKYIAPIENKKNEANNSSTCEK